MAFALAPEGQIADWLLELDNWIRNSAGFFVGRPVVLDLGGVELERDAITQLVAELQQRDIRIMGIEGRCSRADVRRATMCSTLRRRRASCLLLRCRNRSRRRCC
jgi:septum formation inhibitor MinC